MKSCLNWVINNNGFIYFEKDLGMREHEVHEQSLEKDDVIVV